MKPNTFGAGLALVGALSGCAGQQAETNTPQAQDASAKGCDRKDMKDISVISEEPGRIVFKICHTTYVAETRDAAKSTIDGAEKGADAPAKPAVRVKVCDTRDLSNMRIERVNENKSVGHLCDYIYTWESFPLVQSTSVQAVRSSSTVEAEKKEPEIEANKDKQPK